MCNTAAARRRCRGFLPFLAILLTLGSLSGSRLVAASDSTYGQIPLTFTANRGQVHASVRFTAKGPSLTAYFTPAEVVINLPGSTVRMRYLGANISPAVDGLDLQEGRANYLIGADPSLWRTNVPLYGRVVYKDLYPGVDMLYSSHTRLLKSEFIVAPGADPSQIRIAYTGVESLRTDDRGALVLTTADGELREAAPEIYQESGTGRDPVEGAFRVSGQVVTFFVGLYDRSRPLRIDPVLAYSTYLGGGGTDRANAVAVDVSGAAYVTGYTDSTDFPISAGVVKPASGGSVDAFVTKLNAAGSAIVYSTYLGGSGDDRGSSIAVDASGNAYITGYTASTNFPLAGPLQSTFGGTKDAFVTKLNSTGTALIYSTYLGGSGDDRGNGIAIDTSGTAYITGSTTSANFPLSGAFQSALGGQQDGFVAKLNSAGSALVYSTYLGGAADDRGSSIAVDSAGSAYIAGNTSSTNFPTASPLQAANQGSTDAFVTKLSVNGASLIYSTYLGGSGTENIEVGRSIAVDSAGSAYIAGATTSTNFPVFAPLQTSSKGGLYDAFAVKLTPAGTAFAYSTYLGGSSIDFGQSIAVDSSGSSYITGYTSSIDFPSLNADQSANGGDYDVFIAKLSPSGSAVVESGFLGGAAADSAYGIAFDSSGAYIAGQTLSSNFPLKGPVQTSNGGNLAAFVAKFTFGSSVVVSPAFTPAAGTYNPGQSVAITTATALASIRYTTDGSAPSSTVGTLYSAPFSIAITTTVKAIAYKAGLTDSGIVSATYTIVPAGISSATFVKVDTTTQGSWKGTYGANGQAIPNDSTSYPSYAQVAFSGQTPFSWLTTSGDVRAPQKALASDRIPSTWYSFSSFDVDVSLTDGNTHQVALYCLDWTYSGRAERIDVLDSTNGAVLNSRIISSFGGGQYLVWNLTGHVIIRVTLTGGPNAVLSGLFFSAATTTLLPAAAASYVGSDTTTQGSWKGTYGANGEAIPNDSTNFPGYAQVAFSGLNAFSWLPTTTDVRAPQKALASDRIPSTWYTSTNFSIDITLTDGNSHQVALYCLDWTASGRSQRIDILDGANGNVLDTRSVSNFAGGQYLTWNLTGHVTIRVTVTGGPNAAVSGIFFTPPPVATFLGADTTTKGSWKGFYGSNGEVIVNDSTNFPSYAQVNFGGTTPFSWLTTTTDVRALQKALASDRIPSTWYTASFLNIDIVLTDGNAHQVALYCLDWTSSGRAQRIDLIDPVSGSILDSRLMSGFSGGQYMIWNLTGHVTIRVTLTGGPNAVVSGIFF